MSSGQDDRVERVVLVDADDRELGTAPKLDVHRDGRLHRAVSVLLTDGEGQVLLQRRAAGKYHSPQLWTNSCCGHPRPDESAQDAAQRRLSEEMGIRCTLQPAGTFLYRAALEGGLVEHELDHVFVGRWRGRPVPDPQEVSGWRWSDLEALRGAVAAQPHAYTAWLQQVLDVASLHPLMGGDA